MSAAAQTTFDPKRLLTDREVFALRGLSPQFLKDDRRRGRRIPFVQVGRRVFYRVVDIDAAVERLRFGQDKAEPRRQLAGVEQQTQRAMQGVEP